ncbi:Uncharacterised protein [Mycobacterium tuberculosis]|nr:Uncharacterised protein [Mycobacterium tuberculosis]CPA50704.1 Uncharacterised protein [Mycobacterium tuberculosis]
MSTKTGLPSASLPISTAPCSGMLLSLAASTRV